MLRARFGRVFRSLKPTSVRKLMIWVAISGLVCFGVATKWHWASFRRLALSHKAEAISARLDAEIWKTADTAMLRQLKALEELGIDGAVYGSGGVILQEDVEPEKRARLGKLAGDPKSDVEGFRQRLIEESSRRAIKEDRVSRWYLRRWW